MKNDVQKAINEAKAEGATKVIALGHLGIDPSSTPWTSTETIAGLSGLDAFIDGHSHSILEKEIVGDLDGSNVILTQTGEYFDRVGMMVIDPETDEITTDFIELEEIIADDGETVKGYKLASELYSYTLRYLGDGYAMFGGAVNVLDYVMEDYMVLANYISGFQDGIIGSANSPLVAKYPGFTVDYSMTDGCGRIQIGNKSGEVVFDDEVWVGGVKVTDKNKDDGFGNGGSVKYDHLTDTLTLTDATVVNDAGNGISAAGNIITEGKAGNISGENTGIYT